jgi:hypothetical protein
VKLLMVSLRHQVMAKFGRSWNDVVFMRCAFVVLCVLSRRMDQKYFGALGFKC